MERERTELDLLRSIVTLTIVYRCESWILCSKVEKRVEPLT